MSPGLEAFLYYYFFKIIIPSSPVSFADNWFSWTLCAAAVFIGALLVVRGHRYFRTQLFLTAFAGFSFASYIVCRNYVVPDHNGEASSRL
jgi:hypothetical protein